MYIESYSRQDFIFVVVFIVASLLDLKYVVPIVIVVIFFRRTYFVSTDSTCVKLVACNPDPCDICNC
jgi:hypothetical protein